MSAVSGTFRMLAWCVALAIMVCACDSASRAPGRERLVGSVVTSSPPSVGLQGFLAADDSSVVFVQWTESGNRLLGTVTFASLSGAGLDARVDHRTASFEGVLAGGELTLIFEEGFGARENWVGRLDGDELTLTVHSGGKLQHFLARRAQIAAFDEAVQQLEFTAAVEQEVGHQAAAEAAAAQEARERDIAVRQALGSLRKAVSDAHSALDDVVAELEKARLEARDAPMDSYEAAEVRYAAGAVEYERDNVRFVLDSADRTWGRVAAVAPAAEKAEAMQALAKIRSALSLADSHVREAERLAADAEARASASES